MIMVNLNKSISYRDKSNSPIETAPPTGSRSRIYMTNHIDQQHIIDLTSEASDDDDEILWTNSLMSHRYVHDISNSDEPSAAAQSHVESEPPPKSDADESIKIDVSNDMNTIVSDDDYEENEQMRARVLYSAVKILPCCVVSANWQEKEVTVYDGNEVNI